MGLLYKVYNIDLLSGSYNGSYPPENVLDSEDRPPVRVSLAEDLLNIYDKMTITCGTRINKRLSYTIMTIIY